MWSGVITARCLSATSRAIPATRAYIHSQAAWGLARLGNSQAVGRTGRGRHARSRAKIQMQCAAPNARSSRQYAEPEATKRREWVQGPAAACLAEEHALAVDLRPCRLACLERSRTGLLAGDDRCFSRCRATTMARTRAPHVVVRRNGCGNPGFQATVVFGGTVHLAPGHGVVAGIAGIAAHPREHAAIYPAG